MSKPDRLDRTKILETYRENLRRYEAERNTAWADVQRQLIARMESQE